MQQRRCHNEYDKLLLRLEELAKPMTTLHLDYLTARDPTLAVEGHDSLQIAYHVSLLMEAGLVKGIRHPSDESISPSAV